MKSEFVELNDKFHMLDETIEHGSTCHIKSNKLYDFNAKPRAYRIDSLADIGWPDPFPQKVREGKYQAPNLSVEEKLAYREKTQLSNTRILEGSAYIFESIQVNPEEVKDKHKKLLEAMKEGPAEEKGTKSSKSKSPSKKDKG